MTDNSILAFDRSDAVTMSGVISSTGKVFPSRSELMAVLVRTGVIRPIAIEQKMEKVRKNSCPSRFCC